MNTFLKEFRNYCENPKIASGKASSYTNAIKYLCDYLGINEMNKQAINQIMVFSETIDEHFGANYQGLLRFLSQNGRSSYLINGFVQASITQLISFWKTYKQSAPPPVFFANVTWMKQYNGIEVFKNPGAAYVKDNNDAGEKYNFRSIDNCYYGFVECTGNKKINIERIADYYNAEIISENGQRFIDNSLIIFFSNSPDGSGSKIVGVYTSAKIYELPQTVDNPRHNYYFTCSTNNGYLIPVNERNFSVPKQKDGITYFGQDQRWYADSKQHVNFVKRVVEYVKTLKNKWTDTELNESSVLIPQLLDKDISVLFDKDKINGELPLGTNSEHLYISHTYGGTSRDSIKRIRSGRKAEKYFLEFLQQVGFYDTEFCDVANDRKKSYDVELLGYETEIKNIKNGSFFLSDNEIGHIEERKTFLILVSIDNGIWLMKQSSTWLQTRINDIKKTRDFCCSLGSGLDVTDVKISIDRSVLSDLHEISKLGKSEIIDLLTSF